ncbi:MAG: DUF2868 domain-containing protein [Gammaproteobacteria bacterium]|nr:DUF2868 domain-containing protein [Gammaproteobacteria bacterium]
MPNSNIAYDSSLKIVWPIVLAGGFIGLFLSWFVLTGDQLGRVNLFYLLLVYLFIPVVSVIASLFSLVFGKGINLARLLSSIPILPYQTKASIRKMHQLNLDKYWFLLQSQMAAIAFSIASLMTFFILLLATDLNFVWRSTILVPANILPLLEFIALPWNYWEAAQPSLALLEMTQDSRLASTHNGLSDYSVWWKFILATQLCYSLLLRIFLVSWTRWWLKRSFQTDFEQVQQMPEHQSNNQQEEMTELTPQIKTLKRSLVINNWDGIPTEVLTLLPELDLSNDNVWINRWLGSEEQLLKMANLKDEQIVIVKAWEGPLGELEDFLQQGKGVILPLDWDDSGLLQSKFNHLQEWQRFVNTLPNWELYIPKKLIPV